MANSGPGYKKHPDHRVDVEPATQRVTISFDGEVIVDTKDALMLSESGYPAVYYVPRKDVKMDRLQKTDHHTRCPFKGEASYFSLTGKRRVENAVWSYENPYDEVTVIKDHLAFYPDKVSIAVS